MCEQAYTIAYLYTLKKNKNCVMLPTGLSVLDRGVLDESYRT